MEISNPRYPVEAIDYDKLVGQISNAADIKSALDDFLCELPSPKIEKEKEYFWKALHNASRKNLRVWLWLIDIKPGLDTGHGAYTMPEMTSDWTLPVITPDDEDAEIILHTTQYPPEPTEKNFRQQAEVLEKWFTDNAKPDDRCRNVKEYVATLRSSGTGQVEAMIQLASYGLQALASPEGIIWLINNYKP